MPNVRRSARDFLDLVAASLTAAKLDALYGSKWTCQAVLRSLTPLAKVYVLRLLFLDSAISEKSMLEWLMPGAESKHKAALQRLIMLNVVTEERKKDTFYKLNATFQQQLRSVLSTGIGAPRESMKGIRPPSSSDLEAYATAQWESVLLQLVSFASLEGRTTPCDGLTLQLFQNADLLTPGQEPRITQAGFQFLLMDKHSQLWKIIREYVQTAEARGMDIGELIRFLLEIGFYNVGQPYSLTTMSSKQQKFVEELSALGVLQLQQGTKERWFIPTRFAAGLSASLSESSNWQTDGFIMVETNFRVYAYTSSKLNVETLHLFVRTEYILPNIVVGSLTKESVNQAFASGVTAEQIIAFLQLHAHPHVKHKVPSVPETVCDQIRLWEADRVRVKYYPASCYEGFPSAAVFDAVVAEAHRLNALLWEDPNKKRLLVHLDKHDAIKVFMQGLGSKRR